jgi:hypothetical protein
MCGWFGLFDVAKFIKMDECLEKSASNAALNFRVKKHQPSSVLNLAPVKPNELLTIRSAKNVAGHLKLILRQIACSVLKIVLIKTPKELANCRNGLRSSVSFAVTYLNLRQGPSVSESSNLASGRSFVLPSAWASTNHHNSDTNP